MSCSNTTCGSFKEDGTCPVHQPSHYQAKNGLEAIDVIEAFGLNFNRGNAVKYILRAGKKGPTKEDLRKAIWYLQREVDHDAE